MKKIFALALIAALVIPTAASAFEVVIPYVLDGGRVFSLPAENTFQGGAAFITLVNLTDDTLVLGSVYTDANGVPCTPNGNTFLINPQSSFAIRPVAEDQFTEKTAAAGGPKQPLFTVDGADTTFKRANQFDAGFGAVKFVVARPTGKGSVEQYPNYNTWPDAPIYALLQQYNLYDSFAGHPAGFVGGFILSYENNPK